jgi:flagellar protein FliJ
MKARDAALRIKRFEADENSRKASNLESMIRDFHAMASDLDRQIQAEEDRTGVKDTNHFAYSTFAKSAAQRRNNLRASAAELGHKLEAALKARDEAVEQLSDADVPLPREGQRSRRRLDRVDTSAQR